MTDYGIAVGHDKSPTLWISLWVIVRQRSNRPITQYGTVEILSAKLCNLISIRLSFRMRQLLIQRKSRERAEMPNSFDRWKVHRELVQLSTVVQSELF